MLNEQTLNQLRALRLDGMVAALSDAATHITASELPFEQRLALLVQQGLKRNPHGGDLFVFRGRAGSLIKIIWHDGIGMSLYAKRLEKGRFVWPSAKDGMVSLTSSQLACLLEGIDWRNPQYSWRPQSAG